MTSTDYDVRPYADSDEPGVIALWAKVLPDAAPHNDPRANLIRKISHDRDLLLVAATHDAGKILGAAMGGYDGHRGWAYSVAVDPEHQRRGIGTRLLRQLESILREKGCPKLNLQVMPNNPAAVAFYESLGFVVEPRTSMGKRLY